MIYPICCQTFATNKKSKSRLAKNETNQNGFHSAADFYQIFRDFENLIPIEKAFDKRLPAACLGRCGPQNRPLIEKKT